MRNKKKKKKKENERERKGGREIEQLIPLNSGIMTVRVQQAKS